MKKKVIGLTALALAGVFAFTGCGEAKSADNLDGVYAMVSYNLTGTVASGSGDYTYTEHVVCSKLVSPANPEETSIAIERCKDKVEIRGDRITTDYGTSNAKTYSFIIEDGIVYVEASAEPGHFMEFGAYKNGKLILGVEEKSHAVYVKQ